ncbi:MAG TPA: acyltransferase family protein [Acidimicrobiales bacterium]
MAVSTRPQRAAAPTPSRRFFTLAGTRRGTIPHLPALDGMRGIAVLLVIAYHLGWRSFPGGFLGVEVFFVVSGYLITSLIVVELQDKGYLDIGGFWARRLRRLLPALFLLLGFLALVTPVLAPDGVNRLRSDLPWSLLYLANWWQIFAERSYFEATAAPDLLQHLWSLAIEEQFYVVWPPVVAALHTRLWRRRWLLPVVSAAGALASIVAMLTMFDADRDPSRVYYGTDTRASALLIGATLAFVWHADISRRIVNPPPVLVDAAAVLAAVALGLAVVRYNGFDPQVYEGGFVVVSAATALLIVGGCTPGAVTQHLLSVRALRAVGERSYGLYLWHWPIVQLTRPDMDVPFDGWQLTTLRVVLMVIAAEASWRLVERPLRRPRTSGRGLAARRYRRAELALAIALPLLLVPYLVHGRPPANVLESAASPSTGLPSQPSGEESAAPPDVTSEPPTASVPDTTPSSVVAVTTTVVVTEPPPTTTEAPSPGSLGSASSTPWQGTDVLVIGDSVMVGATPAMIERLPGIAIDAVIGRQLRDADEIASQLRDAGRLRPVVVVHLGNNGSATEGQLDRLMEALTGVQRVIVVTANAPRPWRDTVNDRFHDLATRYDNVRVLDWNAVVEGEDGLVGDDGVHLTPTGARRLADLVASAVNSG